MTNTITLIQAFDILSNCAAVIIDNVVTYPTLLNDGESDDDFLHLSWIDSDFNEYFESFGKLDNQSITIDGHHMFLIENSSGDNSTSTLTILTEKNLNNGY